MRISECAALLEQYVTLLERLSKLKTRLGRVENSNLKDLVLAEIERLQTISLRGSLGEGTFKGPAQREFWKEVEGMKMLEELQLLEGPGEINF